MAYWFLEKDLKGKNYTIVEERANDMRLQQIPSYLP